MGMARAPMELALAAVRNFAEQGPQERRFPRAIGSNQHCDFPTTQIKGEVLEDGAPMELHAQIVHMGEAGTTRRMRRFERRGRVAGGHGIRVSATRQTALLFNLMPPEESPDSFPWL